MRARRPMMCRSKSTLSTVLLPGSVTSARAAGASNSATMAVHILRSANRLAACILESSAARLFSIVENAEESRGNWAGGNEGPLIKPSQQTRWEQAKTVGGFGEKEWGMHSLPALGRQ